MIDPQTGYRGSNTMRDMVQDNNFLLHVISRFGIAYGFCAKSATPDHFPHRSCEEVDAPFVEAIENY